jgi:putative ABC transport system substrate-binding protein
MRRREFITLAGGAAAWPLTGRAQQQAKIWRIGFLGFGTPVSWENRVEAFRAGLRDLGYVEGKNIAIEFRWTESIEQLPELAAELVRMKVDLIFATSSTEVEAARRATNAIPIVFATHADPVGLGHVASLSHPGGNITGLTVVQSDLTSKALEILKEVMPQARRFGALFSPTAPSYRPTLEAAKTAGEKLGVEIHPIPVQTVEDFDRAFATMAQEHVDGVFVFASSLTRTQRTPLAELALKHRLPSIFGAKENVQAGGLMSYAPYQIELTRQATTYIDKIIKGAKPSELPVEQPTKFELVVNLKTAKALGLTVPPTLLARADEVIE